jgi:hypothetical protein
MSVSSEVNEEEAYNEPSSSSSTTDEGEDADDTSWSEGFLDKKSTTAVKPARMVINCFGFSKKTLKCVFMVKQVTPVKETTLAQHQFSPPPPFILLCVTWSERCNPHYFHESAHVVQSTADELQMSLSDYLFVHG